MRKNRTKAIVIFLGILLVLSLAKISMDLSFQKRIDGRLYNITHQKKDPGVMMSSNPYDHIKDVDSNEDYKYIVSKGDRSLNYMLKKFSRSNKNGLEEYIMAIACSEILGEDPSSKNWSSGKEWYNTYIDGKK